MKEEKDKKSMKKEIAVGIALVGIICIALFSGCIQQPKQETVTCNPPYIKVGTSCCLDQNNNNICDKDETPIQEQKETQPAQPQTYCGDGTCQSDESCSSCPSDCGECEQEAITEAYSLQDWYSHSTSEYNIIHFNYNHFHSGGSDVYPIVTNLLKSHTNLKNVRFSYSCYYGGGGYDLPQNYPLINSRNATIENSNFVSEFNWGTLRIKSNQNFGGSGQITFDEGRDHGVLITNMEKNNVVTVGGIWNINADKSFTMSCTYTITSESPSLIKKSFLTIHYSS